MHSPIVLVRPAAHGANRLFFSGDLDNHQIWQAHNQISVAVLFSLIYTDMIRAGSLSTADGSVFNDEAIGAVMGSMNDNLLIFG